MTRFAPSSTSPTRRPSTSSRSRRRKSPTRPSAARSSAHREDRVFLEGAYRGQVNGEIQTAYDERGRYEELARSQIHRHRRHLRHHGGHGDPAPPCHLRHEAMSKTIDQIPEARPPARKAAAQRRGGLERQELLAVLLGKGTPGMDVMTLAGKLARLIDEKGLNVTGRRPRRSSKAWATPRPR